MLTMAVFRTVISSCIFLSIVDGARILFFFGLSTYSHRILVWPLVQELTKRGHEVTYFSSSPNRNPKSDPKVGDFVPSAVTEFYKGEGIMNLNLLHSRLDGVLVEKWNEMPGFGEVLCELILKSPDTKEWADKSRFDLIFIDALFNDCGFAFVHKFKTKHILFGTTTIFPWNYDPFGILPETSWIPDVIYHFPAERGMSFLYRLISTLENLRWHFVRQNYYLPRIEELIKTELGMTDLPPISEMEKNVSFFFINTHFSEEYARAIPPFVIPVGGMHITLDVDTNPAGISDQLDKFIKSGKGNGFIYLSFGSDTPISTLPRKQLTAIFSALEKTGVPCIWKWDDEVPENVPKNILLVNWVPQQALLSHPQIKLMVTHGGLLSVHEAIHYKVPLIVIPIFAEQDFNAERVHRKGFGIKLEIREITEEDLTRAIGSILTNPSYKERMEKVSRVFEDRMNNPLETAIWYTEYALRHNDTTFNKPYSMEQKWYERRLLDVWSFIFIFTLISLLGIVYILKYIYKAFLRVFQKSKSGSLESSKKKFKKI